MDRIHCGIYSTHNPVYKILHKKLATCPENFTKLPENADVQLNHLIRGYPDFEKAISFVLQYLYRQFGVKKFKNNNSTIKKNHCLAWMESYFCLGLKEDAVLTFLIVCSLPALRRRTVGGPEPKKMYLTENIEILLLFKRCLLKDFFGYSLLFLDCFLGVCIVYIFLGSLFKSNPLQSPWLCTDFTPPPPPA